MQVRVLVNECSEKKVLMPRQVDSPSGLQLELTESFVMMTHVI